MMTRTLFMIFITFNTLSTYNCLSMELEKEDKIITLDQGLLTVIPAKMTKEGYQSAGFFGNTKTISTINEKKDSLINLWNYERSINAGPYNWEYFRPLIMKVITQQDKSLIHNFGTFYKNNKSTHHREAKEAIRERKAIYYTRKQGILIYSLSEQPDSSIVTHIDYMLDNDKQQMTIPQL